MIDDFRPVRPKQPAPTLKQTATETDSDVVPFQTPDQVQEHSAATIETAAPVSQPPQGSGHHWFNLPWPPTKLEIWLSSLVLVVVSIGVLGFVTLHHPKHLTTPKVTAKAAASTIVAAAPVYSTLSGLPASDETNQRPVIGVMIENSQTARPQSGLSQAGVVFEAIAEGGITRFLALYQDQQPTNIGPVRSARPYYVQWLQGFQAAYAHVGGSTDALQDIKDWGVQDMNQFYNSGPYHRVRSRPAPHNMYSSVVDLTALANQKGYKSNYSGFPRKTASPVKQLTATSIDMSISSAPYNAHYVYDSASNSYPRSEGGTAQIDANTGKQLAPNVVIGMVTPLSAGGKTAQGGSYSDYNVIGSGAAFVFQDGTVTSATWHKESTNAQISFTDTAGNAVKLNPGQTWITALANAGQVSYH